MRKSPRGPVTTLETPSALTIEKPAFFLHLWFIVIFLVLFGVSPTAIAADEKAVLVLGDSLSAGYGISVEESWPNLLQQRLQEEGYGHQVVNVSVSGDTTRGGARRLGPLIIEHDPDVVVIALGANDGLRGIKVAEIRKNLTHIINVSQVIGASVVLIKVRIPPNYGPGYTESFEAVFDNLGRDDEVMYAPFMLERFAADQSAFQRDGLHPTAEAQPQILDTLWPTISEALDSGAGIEDFF